MDQNLNIAIVTIAYNRPDSLLRLLNSLKKVDFEGHNVPLYISIDYSGDDSVYKLARSFSWEFGEKKVIQHTSNLGLKKHVLTCGDLVNDYDALIVLEDDLIVSKAMYSYTYRAVEKYKDDDNIAAISLFTKGWSETAFKPFVAAPSCFDTYFIQTAESLGQVWIKDKWIKFKQWYESHSASFGRSERIPLNVRQWDEKSWKKYHIWYCIDENKFTVYPYIALTTCSGDEGEHVINSEVYNNIGLIQVPLQKDINIDYRFADFNDNKSVKYDAFLERFISESDTCMDLYGQKTDYTPYSFVITPKILNYKIIETYGLLMRPHEENIYRCEKGRYFYKYDLSINQKNKVEIHSEMAMRYYNYIDYEGVTNQMMVSDIVKQLLRVLKRRIKKLFRRK